MDKDFIPKRLEEYREREYWDRRYTSDSSHYDWLLTYSNIRPILNSYIRTSDRILNVGCGSSSIPSPLLLIHFRVE